MEKIIRTIGFVIVVAVLTWGIFLVVVPDKEVKQDVLEFSLNLLGDKLLGMVPESAEKDVVKAKYEEFKQQALERKLQPTEVEEMAVNILNASQLETELTPTQAKAVIQLVCVTEEPKQVCSSKISKAERTSASASASASPSTSASASDVSSYEHTAAEQWETIGKRINRMYHFNENLHRTIHGNPAMKHDLPRQIRYHVDAGIKIALDTRLKHALLKKELHSLSSELQQLQKEKLLEWRENYAEELQADMEELREELKSLKELKKLKRLGYLHQPGELKELEKLKALESLEALEQLEVLRTIPVSKHIGLEVLKSLESLKSLEALKNIPGVDGDSIRKAVEESLKEAGIILKRLEAEEEEVEEEDEKEN